MSRAASRLAWLVLVVLWALTAWNKSLSGDEFHSLHHARIPLADFLAVVRTDNHPPLSFLVLKGAIALFGAGHLALRLPGLLYALAFHGLVVRVARRLPDPRVRALAPWLVLLSSYRSMVFTEARMYGLLALCVLGLVETTLAAFEGRRVRLAAASCVALGLHTHYYFFHYLGVLVACVLWIAWRTPALRPAVRHLFRSSVLGALVFLPWGLWGFAVQLGHGLPAGSDYSRLDTWLQSLAHFLFMNASLGGEWLTYGVALPAVVMAAALALLGCAPASRAAADPATRRLLQLLVAVGLVTPAWAGLAAQFIPRAPYNWPYVSPSCAPLLLLVGLGLAARARRAALVLAALLMAAMSAVTLVNAFSPGQEDFRGAVAHILAHARPGDALITRGLWDQGDQDPRVSPTGWSYYLERLPPPAGAAVPSEYPLSRWRGALQHERVWIFIRRYWSKPVRTALEAAYTHEEAWSIGPVLVVRLYWRE
jgi:hypothetical protein